MLTHNEKTSIELQEQYRHEVAQRFKTKSKIDYIEACTNKKYEIPFVDQQALKQASLRLAPEARHFTVNTYLDEDEKKNYNSR